MSKEERRIPEIHTREENGMRISLSNQNLRFPTDATLREALDAMNDTAENHKLKPCDNPDDCEMCFLAKAGGSSKIFTGLAKQYTEMVLGPFLHLIDPSSLFSIVFFFYMLGAKVERSRGGNSFKAEVDELEKLFNAQPKDNSTGEVPSNPS